MSNIALLTNPIKYANGAISVIEDQLKSAVSDNRKTKLRNKLNEWKKFIELMQENTVVSDASSTSEEIKE